VPKLLFSSINVISSSEKRDRQFHYQI